MSCTGSGDRNAATEAYKKAEEKTAGSGPKMDLVFNTLKYVCVCSNVHHGHHHNAAAAMLM